MSPPGGERADEMPGNVPGAWYAAFLLALAGALSQIDRQIMGLLMEPVKLDLHLSDVQVSLLYGLAFVLFHTLAAFPLGYLADRMPRMSLIAASVFAWSLATAFCGLARSFTQLFVARMAVGVGESTLQPATQSLLPDYFSARSLPAAFAIVQTGVLLGGGTAYILGGAILGLVGSEPVHMPLLGVLKPWQVTFVIISAAGPLVALLMLTTREPDRRSNPLISQNPESGRGVWAFVLAHRMFLLAYFAMVSITSVQAFGVLAWTPSFLIRSFGWTAMEAGIVYGLVLMIAGGTGTISSSIIARRWSRDGRVDAPVRVNLLALVLAAPLAVVFPLVGEPALALACLAGFSLCVGVTSTMMPVMLQLAAPNAVRGRLAAVYVFATSAVGAALGPVLVALVSDYFIGRPGQIQDAIAVVGTIVGPLAIILNIVVYLQYTKSFRD